MRIPYPRPTPSRVRFTENEFKHRFGGAPSHGGVIPEGGSVPMHLFMVLDARDPLVPIKPDAADINMIPLYYPLRYGWGDVGIQYSVDSDEKITILSPIKPVCNSGEEYPYPNQFPGLPVSLVPLSYVQHRAIVATDNSCDCYCDDPDWEADWDTVRDMDTLQMVRFLGSFDEARDRAEWKCRNPNCESNGAEGMIDVFAKFTDRITDEVSIYDNSDDFVAVYFFTVTCCNTIGAVQLFA